MREVSAWLLPPSPTGTMDLMQPSLSKPPPSALERQEVMLRPQCFQKKLRPGGAAARFNAECK